MWGLLKHFRSFGFFSSVCERVFSYFVGFWGLENMKEFCGPQGFMEDEFSFILYN